MTRQARLASVLLTAALSLPVFAASEQPAATDLTVLFAQNGVALQSMRVMEIGGIVVIRGRASDSDQAENAAIVARNLGYTRVANLVQIAAAADDAAIERVAERELTIHRALDGCHFRVASHDGVVTLGGTVAHELQKDAAIALVRNIDGVRAVRNDLQR